MMEDIRPKDVSSGTESRAQQRLAHGVSRAARWSLRLLLILAMVYVLGWVIGLAWVMVLPVLLAFLLSAMLFTPMRFLRKKLPATLAAAIVVLGTVGVVLGLVAVLVPLVQADFKKLSGQGTAGLDSLRDLLAKPPFNVQPDELGGWIDQGIAALKENTDAIANQVGNALGVISSAAAALVLTLVMTFFILRDGTRFLRWLTGWTGSRAGRHASVILTRIFDQLGSFVWSQAAVSLVDGVFIGLGLWILGVPLVLPLAIVTFFGGFIPIIGAFATGILAVLVALVSNGVETALWVVLLVVLVQQLEGNLLSPFLVGKAMTLHPALILGSVTIGGSIAGIVGAFLAVPVTATGAIICGYVRERVMAGTKQARKPAISP